MTKHKFKTEPWAHQTEAFEFAYDKPAAMLAMDMGTGKSKVALDIIQNRDHHRIMVVCPNKVTPVWPGQWKIHGWKDIHVEALNRKSWTIARKTERAKGLWLYKKPVIIIVNYEMAWRKPFSEWILKQARLGKLDLVVLDESHRIKAPGGKTSWFFKKLGRAVPWRLCLTGTPMSNSPLDIYAQYRFLDPDIYGTSFHRFQLHYAIRGGFEGKQIIGFKNIDDLHNRFFSLAYRVEAEDVLDLPAQHHIIRTVELEASTMKAYRALENTFITQVKEGIVTASNALVKLLRLQQATSGFLITEDGKLSPQGTAKYDELVDILTDINPEYPVAVFCRYHQDLDAIKRAAESLKRPATELSGRTRPDTLIDGVWKPEPGEVMALQIQSGKEGIDLTASHYSIYYSQTFSLGDYEQSLKRQRRPGQTRPVTYIHLVAQYTVDQKIMKALAEKKSVVESVLNEYQDK